MAPFELQGNHSNFYNLTRKDLDDEWLLRSVKNNAYSGVDESFCFHDKQKLIRVKHFVAAKRPTIKIKN
jgi:hypothetical protein